MAKPIPAVKLDPNSPVFQTPAEAADAVSKDFAKAMGEQAAVVIKRPDGTYGYSTVVPGGDDDFSLRALLPKGHSMAGIVHSHPGQDDAGQYFSPNDLNTATNLNVPSYVRFDRDNSLRSYTPGQTKTQMVQLPGSHYVTKAAYGDPVTVAPPPPAPDASAGVVAAVTPRDNQPTQIGNQ